MKHDDVILMKSEFDKIKQNIQKTDVEFWLARELQYVLGYERWENFSKIVLKASQACINSGENESDHFRGVTKMVQISEERFKSSY